MSSSVFAMHHEFSLAKLGCVKSASIAVAVGGRQVEPLVLGPVVDRQAADRQAADKQPTASEVRLASRQLMPSLARLLYVQLLLRQLLPWLPFFLYL